jgi:hypothetical protein
MRHLTLNAAALFPLLAPLLGAQGSDSLVYYDWVDELGVLRGGHTWVATGAMNGLPPVPASQVSTLALSSGGPSENRVDLVFVGDGYTASELGSFQNHVDSQSAAFFQMEPFKRYESYFNVHRVDVISNDSGVDNDPTQGITRDTALDMAFWCSNIERLLCVNVGKAYSFANQAPDVDYVVAVANSSKYGGAGYPTNNLGTVAGGNSSASQVLIHELGHAMGNLADEYTYGGPQVYSGPEPNAPNSSKQDATMMASTGQKWATWLGESFPSFDGLVSTFEGSSYSQLGVYRPSNNSCMRNLNRPFNMPSVESLLIEIYKRVDPIDDSSSEALQYQGDEVLFVTAMDPVGSANSLEIQWFLDDVPIIGATGPQLDLSTLSVLGSHEVRVEVVDSTTWVRDESARSEWMTGGRSFDVGSSPVTSYCTTSPNSTGLGAVMGWTGSTSVVANDLQLQVVSSSLGTPGVFFYGQNQVSQPFGDGVRCVGGGIYRLGPIFSDGNFGFAEQWLDLTDPPQPAGQINAGSTWNFQFWYRDPLAAGSGFNLSDALSAIFLP